ncbi:Hint domain-containing protein [Paracoccus sp. DMF-8]|uniref:Hint domain-containing protein n=1 Tax=Paracoccus sp. DMF-8 TaxID=3019445 RepID=UPI0023E7BF51|nr:Hint domain-containing protein [Paracoccus sp. DMF-8]MDF3605681.1 Hint domain-containing protein [Paracoccus sp. DMF-8]
MQYAITMVTFSTTIPSGASGTDARRAFYGQRNFDFTNAQVGQVVIEDDDEGFDYIRHGATNYPVEHRQVLVDPTIIGTDTAPLPAGTQFSAYPGSILTDSLGQQFYALFTTIADPEGGAPIEVGDRHSALILPIPSTDAEGVQIWPSFDPTLVFRQTGTITFGTNTPSIPYDPSSQVDPSDPTCFTAGTLIQTPDGPREVQDLRIGDLILTRDHGAQPLRWIGGRVLDAGRLDLSPNLRPIRIGASALGAGLPRRDLTVSPQHRVLVRSAVASRMFACSEVLIAAKHLVGLPGIAICRDLAPVTYLHLLFDDHQILLSEGAWSESFFIGPQALKNLKGAQRREILSLFPELARTTPRPARPMPNGRQSRKLAQRHARNGRELVVAD